VKFIFHPLAEKSAQAILQWHYPPPYDFYNLTASESENSLFYLLDPSNAFYGLFDAEEHLLAFCSFGLDGQVSGGDYRLPALDIGLGLRPDLTGQGHGSEYVKAVIDFAQQTFRPTQLRVTIAEFNARALRVWEKAGFRRVQVFQGGLANTSFVILLKTR
jgi:[ribosomal protein S18]-alanine N-acetyltransferase